MSGGPIRVAILMGSPNDLPTMQPAVDTLRELGVACEARAISAHRTPDRLHRYVEEAEGRGVRVFVCGAGGAAHLAGVTASLTLRPVLGVPIESSPLSGFDALLSTVQMPGGVPVATFGVGRSGARNAALFAAQILALGDADLAQGLGKLRERQAEALPLEPLA